MPCLRLPDKSDFVTSIGRLTDPRDITVHHLLLVFQRVQTNHFIFFTVAILLLNVDCIRTAC